MKHAEQLVDRILFLERTPVMNEPFKLTIGKEDEVVGTQMQAVNQKEPLLPLCLLSIWFSCGSRFIPS